MRLFNGRSLPILTEEDKSSLPALWIMVGLGLALLLALVLNLLQYVGYGAHDDVAYLFYAHKIITGQSLISPDAVANPLDHLYQLVMVSRMGQLLILAALMLIFKSKVLFVCASIIVFHLGLVWLAYWVGRMLHGVRVGMISAILMAGSIIATSHAGVALPDLPQTFFFSLGFAIIIRCALSWTVLRPTVRGILLLLAGISLGYASAIKGTTNVQFPMVFLMLLFVIPGKLMSKNNLVGLLWLVSGVALVFCLRIALAGWLTHGAWWDLGYSSKYIDIGYIVPSINISERAHFMIDKLFFDRSLALMTVGGLLYIFFRQGTVWLPLNFWPLALLISSGIGGIHPLTIVPSESRYFAPILVPGTVMGAYIIWIGCKYLERILRVIKLPADKIVPIALALATLLIPINNYLMILKSASVSMPSPSNRLGLSAQIEAYYLARQFFKDNIIVVGGGKYSTPFYVLTVPQKIDHKLVVLPNPKLEQVTFPRTPPTMPFIYLAPPIQHDASAAEAALREQYDLPQKLQIKLWKTVCSPMGMYYDWAMGSLLWGLNPTAATAPRECSRPSYIYLAETAESAEPCASQ